MGILQGSNEIAEGVVSGEPDTKVIDLMNGKFKLSHAAQVEKVVGSLKAADSNRAMEGVLERLLERKFNIKLSGDGKKWIGEVEEKCESIVLATTRGNIVYFVYEGENRKIVYEDSAGRDGQVTCYERQSRGEWEEVVGFVKRGGLWEMKAKYESETPKRNNLF